MPDRSVRVHLEASPTEVTSADGIVTDFTLVQRAMRATILFFLCVLLAGMILAIPIVHLVGVPLLLVTGIALGVKQFSATERLRPIRMACPKCGGPNRLGGGMGRRSLAEPMDRACENCRRGLVLRIEPATAS
jgi:hypothetical protein